MEPIITTAIITGIGSGAAASATQAVTSKIGVAYVSFKNLLAEKFGKNNQLLLAIGELEKESDSPSRRGLVQEKVDKLGVDKDQELNAAATKLFALVKEVQPESISKINLSGSGVIVRGNGAVGAGNGGIAIKGDVHGGINMPGK